MAEKFSFARNTSDLSTDQGFQFEFVCDRCGTAVRSSFQTSALGMASGVLDAASSLLGGLFSSAADVGDRVRSAAWKRAHDAAFQEACREVQGEFVQCPRCQAWVCRSGCWNERKGLCKSCAPDLGVEMAAAQSSKAVEEVWAHAQMAEEDKRLSEEDWREGIRATCPSCGAALPRKVRFCPQCGGKISQARHCTQCGGKLDPADRFCPSCGAVAQTPEA